MSTERDGHVAVVQYSDQCHCNVCKRTWDMNDPDPPPCEPVEQEKPKPKRPRFGRRGYRHRR